MKTDGLNKLEPTTTYTKSKGIFLSGKKTDSGEIIRVVDYVNENSNDQDHQTDEISNKVVGSTITAEAEAMEA